MTEDKRKRLAELAAGAPPPPGSLLNRLAELVADIPPSPGPLLNRLAELVSHTSPERKTAVEKTKRRIFYSFYYKEDVTRASQVRNIGAVEGNKSATDNEWEKITSGKDAAAKEKAIKQWIADQMENRTCTVVLVGQNTADRYYINHEIVKSWNDKMGVVGIYIHGLKNLDGNISTKGSNPFDYVTYGNPKKKLSTAVKCYNPMDTNSKERYAWIEKNLSDIIEEAIKIRAAN
ncbi:MAG: TIR domain-containing protein [Syntrophobacteraceae bacterium]